MKTPFISRLVSLIILLQFVACNGSDSITDSKQILMPLRERNTWTYKSINNRQPKQTVRLVVEGKQMRNQMEVYEVVVYSDSERVATFLARNTDGGLYLFLSPSESIFFKFPLSGNGTYNYVTEDGSSEIAFKETAYNCPAGDFNGIEYVVGTIRCFFSPNIGLVSERGFLGESILTSYELH
jgi:hypothetical protein